MGFSYDSEGLDTPLYDNNHLSLVGFSGFSQEYFGSVEQQQEGVCLL